MCITQGWCKQSGYPQKHYRTPRYTDDAEFYEFLFKKEAA